MLNKTMIEFFIINSIILNIKTYLLIKILQILIVLILLGFSEINIHWIKSYEIAKFLVDKIKVINLCNNFIKMVLIFFCIFEYLRFINASFYFSNYIEKKDEKFISESTKKMLKFSVYLDYKGGKND